VAQKVVFLVEMAAEHLGRLIHRMLNLDGYAPTRLRFLDNLGCQTSIILRNARQLATYIKWLMVNL